MRFRIFMINFLFSVFLMSCSSNDRSTPSDSAASTVLPASYLANRAAATFASHLPILPQRIWNSEDEGASQLTNSLRKFYLAETVNPRNSQEPMKVRMEACVFVTDQGPDSGHWIYVEEFEPESTTMIRQRFYQFFERDGKAFIAFHQLVRPEALSGKCLDDNRGYTILSVDEELLPSTCEMQLSRSNGVFYGQTTAPCPTAQGGSMEVKLELTLTNLILGFDMIPAPGAPAVQMTLDFQAESGGK